MAGNATENIEATLVNRIRFIINDAKDNNIDIDIVRLQHVVASACYAAYHQGQIDAFKDVQSLEMFKDFRK